MTDFELKILEWRIAINLKLSLDYTAEEIIAYIEKMEPVISAAIRGE